jgi:hypothetical protein
MAKQLGWNASLDISVKLIGVKAYDEEFVLTEFQASTDACCKV